MHTQSIIAWRESPIPVTHTLSKQSISLQDLTQPHVISTLADQLIHSGTFQSRTAYMMIVHYAVDAMVIAWFAPLIRDKALFTLDANDVGFILGTQGQLSHIWIHPDIAQTTMSVNMSDLGQIIAPIMNGIVTSIHKAGHIGKRGITIVFVEALIRRITALTRCYDHELPCDWSQALLYGLGYIAKPQNTVTVHPDDGPAIEMPIPTVCCVLSRYADQYACPTCPQHASHAVRRTFTEAWLATLNAHEFLGVTGRHRIGGQS